MTYTVTGVWRRRTITVTWEDGKLSGYPHAVEAVEFNARLMEGRLVGPGGGGVYTETKHLESPLSALMLIVWALDGVISITGDVPQLPALGPDVVG